MKSIQVKDLRATLTSSERGKDLIWELGKPTLHLDLVNTMLELILMANEQLLEKSTRRIR
jgi:hypothetical protein